MFLNYFLCWSNKGCIASFYSLSHPNKGTCTCACIYLTLPNGPQKTQNSHNSSCATDSRWSLRLTGNESRELIVLHCAHHLYGFHLQGCLLLLWWQWAIMLISSSTESASGTKEQLRSCVTLQAAINGISWGHRSKSCNSQHQLNHSSPWFEIDKDKSDC